MLYLVLSINAVVFLCYLSVVPQKIGNCRSFYKKAL